MPLTWPTATTSAPRFTNTTADWTGPPLLPGPARALARLIEQLTRSGEIVGFGIDGTWKPATDFERDKAPKGDKNGAGKMDPTERAALDALVARPPLPCSAGRGTRARCAWETVDAPSGALRRCRDGGPVGAMPRISRVSFPPD